MRELSPVSSTSVCVCVVHHESASPQYHHHYPNCMQAYDSNLPGQGLPQCLFADHDKVSTHGCCIVFIGRA